MEVFHEPSQSQICHSVGPRHPRSPTPNFRQGRLRHLQAILDETMRAYIEEKQNVKPPCHVLGARPAWSMAVCLIFVQMSRDSLGTADMLGILPSLSNARGAEGVRDMGSLRLPYSDPSVATMKMWCKRLPPAGKPAHQPSFFGRQAGGFCGL